MRELTTQQVSRVLCHCLSFSRALPLFLSLYLSVSLSLSPCLSLSISLARSLPLSLSRVFSSHSSSSCFFTFLLLVANEGRPPSRSLSFILSLSHSLSLTLSLSLSHTHTGRERQRELQTEGDVPASLLSSEKGTNKQDFGLGLSRFQGGSLKNCLRYFVSALASGLFFFLSQFPLSFSSPLPPPPTPTFCFYPL